MNDLEIKFKLDAIARECGQKGEYRVDKSGLMCCYPSAPELNGKGVWCLVDISFVDRIDAADATQVYETWEYKI